MNNPTREQVARFKRAKAAKKVAWRRLPPSHRDDPALYVPCPNGHAAVGAPCRPSPRAVCPARCELAAHVAPPDVTEAPEREGGPS